MTVRLFHCSDVHAGPPFDADVAEVLRAEAHTYAPDLFVVSGDFVQRADFEDQWQTITAWLAGTPQPRLVVPGNHDVPLYHVWQRLFQPYGQYRKHISDNLTPVVQLDGVTVIGANTAFGLTVDGGWLSPAQQQHIRTAALAAPAHHKRVVVMHHHLVNPAGVGRRSRVAQSEQIAKLFDECQIDVVMSGHIHLSYVGHTRDTWPQLAHGTIICQAGTGSSRRGKSRERHQCAYNTIEISTREVCIRRHVYQAEARAFVIQVEHRERLLPWS
jgi:3',5'-cyclic AMP phosphodiesterase CpdA